MQKLALFYLKWLKIHKVCNDVIKTNVYLAALQSLLLQFLKFLTDV